MEPQEIISKLLDEKIVKILKFFFQNNNEFYLREIARHTKVSPASTYRILNKLISLNIIGVREIKRVKLYYLLKNKTTELLNNLVEVDVVDYFTERAKDINGVELIILLGEKTKERANILLLGESIDTSNLRLLVAHIKEKYSFTINQMCLTKEQYEQMSSMGLYPGKKTILWRRVSR